MRTWRISVSTTIALVAMLWGCSVAPDEPDTRGLDVRSAAVTAGALLQYHGGYIVERPNVRVVFWRTSNGVAVTAEAKAAAGPMVSAIIAGAYFDWLKAEYTTPAATSPVGVSLVPSGGSYAGQIETTSGLTTIITDAEIRAQIAGELASGNLGPHSGNTSTDTQLVVLVVVPATVSVRDIGVSASSSDVPYHANTFGADSIAYVVVHDDASFVANASAGIISAVLNPYADFVFEAWSSGYLTFPFREAGCAGGGPAVPVLDPASSLTLFAAPLVSNAQGGCIGPPLQITDAAGNPAPASQTQSVAAIAQPSPFAFYATNRSLAPVSLSSAAACTFATPTLAPGATVRFDCAASSSVQNVTLNAALGAITYRTGVRLTVACPAGYEFDGITCAPLTFDCDICACGCNAAGTGCTRCPPPPRCNPKLGCDSGDL